MPLTKEKFFNGMNNEEGKSSRIKLSENDKKEIERINKNIDTVPKDIVEKSLDKVFYTLENNHPLNRLIRDEKGVPHAYLACIDDKEKEAYLRYLASDGTMNLSLIEEMRKLLKRAEKLKYKSIAFNGANTILNRFLTSRFGFKKDKSKDIYAGGGKVFPYFIKKLEDTVVSLVDEDIKYLKENAENVLNQIDIEGLKRSLEDAHRKHFDIKIEDLYGTLYTLTEAKDPILSTNYSIPRLHERANQIQRENDKERKVSDYTNALLETFSEEEKKYKEEIKNILRETKPSKYNETLLQFFEDNKIVFDKNVNYNEIYFNSLVHKEPINHGTYIINGEKITLLELVSMDHLKEETEIMKHCIGKSDFYINKIKKGEIQAISLRDSDNIPHYTLEYEKKTKNIKQFKGGNDTSVNSLPGSKKIVIDTFNAFEKSGMEIQKCSENFDYCLYKNTKDKTFNTLENKELTIDYIKKNKDLTFIKGNLTVPQSITKEDLDLVLKTGIDVDLTNVPQKLKDGIKSISGNVTDNSMDILYPLLKNVSGSFWANSATEINLPNLTSIGEFFSANSATEINLPNLTSVSGFLSANSATEINLPNLTSIGGSFWADSVTKINLLNLKEIKKEFKINLNILKTLNINPACEIETIIDLSDKNNVGLSLEQVLQRINK